MTAPAGRTARSGHADQVPVLDRSVMRGVRGLPSWGAILLAAVLTLLGVFLDLERTDRLGVVFQVLYFAGCVLAICWVRRRGLFGPVVAPPLLLAGAVLAVVLMTGAAPTGSLVGKVIAVGSPMLNGFPTMAVTTAATLAVGIVRLRVQRPPRTADQARARSSGYESRSGRR